MYWTKLNSSCENVHSFILEVRQLTWTDLKSTQLHEAFIGHARQRHDYASYWFAAAKIGRLVLERGCSHWSLVHVLWTSV